MIIDEEIPSHYYKMYIAMCSRCSRDKNEMKDLTQIEEMLIVRALPIIKVCKR